MGWLLAVFTVEGLLQNMQKKNYDRMNPPNAERTYLKQLFIASFQNKRKISFLEEVLYHLGEFILEWNLNDCK